VPDEIEFRRSRKSLCAGLAQQVVAQLIAGVVLADAAYDINNFATN